MTVFVDHIKDWGEKGMWCHMLSDESEEELHEFAARMGMPRKWFQANHGPGHYDLTPTMRRKAVSLGAQPATLKDIGRILRLWRESQS